MLKQLETKPGFELLDHFGLFQPSKKAMTCHDHLDHLDHVVSHVSTKENQHMMIFDDFLGIIWDSNPAKPY